MRTATSSRNFDVAETRPSSEGFPRPPARSRHYRGRVSFWFVRFIRSDSKLRLLNRAITMPQTSFTSTSPPSSTSLPPAEGNLRVLRQGEIVATTTIAIGGR